MVFVVVLPLDQEMEVRTLPRQQGFAQFRCSPAAATALRPGEQPPSASTAPVGHPGGRDPLGHPEAAQGLVLTGPLAAPPALARVLRERGIDAMTASELGLAGSPDPDLLAWAAVRDAMVVAENVADFACAAGELLPSGGAPWRRPGRPLLPVLVPTERDPDDRRSHRSGLGLGPSGPGGLPRKATGPRRARRGELDGDEVPTVEGAPVLRSALEGSGGTQWPASSQLREPRPTISYVLYV